ncbi:MAG TPA: hypothetical protein VKE70_07660, partial [Candidatus Solibacter sp.]|nr:hypothetical protein [Candidatus Solibacter sp.]
MAKAKANLAEMPDLRLEIMDLLDPGSIDAFAEQFVRNNKKLHILVNNAGIMAPPLARDARVRISILRQPSRPFPAHLPALACPGRRPRRSCRRAYLLWTPEGWGDFHDPNFDRREYDPWIAYGQSKTANALFAVAMDSIGQRRGVRAFSVHPGGIVTDLIR